MGHTRKKGVNFVGDTFKSAYDTHAPLLHITGHDEHLLRATIVEETPIPVGMKGNDKPFQPTQQLLFWPKQSVNSYPVPQSPLLAVMILLESIDHHLVTRSSAVDVHVDQAVLRMADAAVVGGPP